VGAVFDLGGGMSLVWGVIGLLGSALAVGALLWVAAKGHSERHDEDAARAYFDAHGHWPDDERVTTP
jgi:hypothetical protein